MSDKMVVQFMQMVRIPSESGEEKEMIDYLFNEFKKMEGNVQRDNYGNLIVKFPAKNCCVKQPVLFSCHADTVKPGKGIEPVLKDGVIRSAGDTILGADDKAGIAELMEAIRTAEVRPPLEIAISREEEVGLLGVKNMDYSLLSAKYGFLLDNDTLQTIVIGGPSYYTIDAVFTGRSAHAGMEPEKGISAILAASKAITALKLGRIDEDTTANVGIIEGGMIRNGVPGKASFKAECRSLKHEKAQKLAEEMKEIIEREAESTGAKADVHVNNLCEAVDIPEDSWTVKTSKRALAKAGVDAETTFITGFTDASIYNNKGIETAVVGIGAQLEHSTDEHIKVEDMIKAKEMILEIFRISAEELD